MKLTKKQKDSVEKHNWDVISNDDGNCAWISIAPEDGVIFGEVCQELGLTGDEEDVKLLVIGTKEGDV
jgi:hypothetical protein